MDRDSKQLENPEDLPDSSQSPKIKARNLEDFAELQQPRKKAKLRQSPSMRGTNMGSVPGSRPQPSIIATGIKGSGTINAKFIDSTAIKYTGPGGKDMTDMLQAPIIATAIDHQGVINAERIINKAVDICTGDPNQLIYEDKWTDLFDTGKCYPLDPYKRTGKCLVAMISNAFDRKGESRLYSGQLRLGASKDKENMMRMFRHLNCDPVCYDNVGDIGDSQWDLPTVLTDIKTKLTTANYDSFVVVISSHGEKDNILMDNLKLKNLFLHIVYEFSHEKFSEFQGKPKMFLVQACQNIGDPSEPLLDPNSYDIVKQESMQDTLVSMATLPYSEAYRSEETGSFFIEAIHDIFSRHWKKLTLREMLKLVHDEVIKKGEKYGIKQSPWSQDMGFKDYVFKC